MPQITLIGMFDSPFVRRVAITLNVHGLAFSHHNWSVFRDAEKVRRFNPLGQVPVLLLDEEVLIDSSAIVDALEELAGPDRATLPAGGAARREEMGRLSVALGACDKAAALIYERFKRSPQGRDPAWDDRLVGSLRSAFDWLGREIADPGERLLQSQITTGVLVRFIQETFEDIAIEPPRLRELSKVLEAHPAFRDAPFPTER